MKVFVVDDDAIFRDTIAIALDELPIERVECRDGAEALQAFATEIGNYGVVLLDIEMPDMNGLEVCRRLRKMDARNKTVIFISANDDLQTRFDAYGAGGEDYFVKPINLTELHQHVATYVAAETQRSARVAKVPDEQRSARAQTETKENELTLAFMRQCARIKEAPAIAEALMQAVWSLGLSPLVEIRGRESLRVSPDGECTELEKSILAYAGGLKNSVQIDGRVALSLKFITLVASGLTEDDIPRNERLTGLLTALVDVSDARMEDLMRISS